jgi:DNA-dependent RNA polymerase auxiliary subunit epsilon
MGFKKLFYFMLGMIKESSQNALERFFAKTGEDIHMTQQAFSLARQKIKWQAFRIVFVFTVNTYYLEYKKDMQRWNGMRVFAVDGSQMALPNDKPLRKYFGTSGPGDTSPMARGSMLYDILNDLIADAQIEPMSTDERTPALMHISQLKGLESFEKWRELLLFDRGYPSFELIKELLGGKIHFLMRVRKKFSTKIDGLGHGDHIIYLQQGDEKIPVRVIKFLLEGGEEETLITDLLEKKYGTASIKALYFKRWPVETKYDQVKKKLEIENFSGRLADNIRQDFYAAMVIANLLTDIKYEAQEEVEAEQEGKDNKYEYKINVNHAIGVIKDKLIQTLCEEDDEKRSEMFDEMIELLKKRIIPIRPNRSFPRTTPRKARFHHNHKSNC